MADNDLLEFGSKHALHGGLDLVYAVIDNAVHTNIDVSSRRAVTRSVIRANVKAHNDSAGSRGQHHIGLIDGTYAAVDNFYAHLFVSDLLKRCLDGLSGTLNVGLDNNVEIFHLTGLDLTEQVLKAYLLAAAEGGILLLGLALFNELAGHTLIVNGVEYIAGARHLGHTRYLNRYGGTGLGYADALVVYHGADTADSGACNNNVSEPESSVLYENGHDRAAALVEPCLNNGALGGAVGICLELLHFGKNNKVLKQIVYSHAGLGGDRANNGVAAPFLGNDVIFGELLLYALGIRANSVHLVYGNNEGYAGCFCMVYALNGLWHDAVVSGDDEYRNIRDHSAAGAHGGKRLMTRSVKEGDRTSVYLDCIRTDMLSDTAGLTGSDVCMADVV